MNNYNNTNTYYVFHVHINHGHEDLKSMDDVHEKHININEGQSATTM